MDSQPCQPLITTVIPTYRRPALLAQAIRSVLTQTYPHFLVCVYDNASADETADVGVDEATQVAEVFKDVHDSEFTGYVTSVTISIPLAVKPICGIRLFLTV